MITSPFKNISVIRKSIVAAKNIKKGEKFSKYNLELKKNLSKYRWTIDEPEHFVVIKNILNHFKNKYNFSWTDIVKLEKAHPEYFIPNKHILRDEGSKLNIEQKLWKRAKKIRGQMI